MKVFVVTREPFHENSTLIGVYVSEEDAVAACVPDSGCYDPGEEYFVRDMVIGESYHNRSWNDVIRRLHVKPGK